MSASAEWLRDHAEHSHDRQCLLSRCSSRDSAGVGEAQGSVSLAPDAVLVIRFLSLRRRCVKPPVPGEIRRSMNTRSDRLLEIYFADHLAASTAGLELARRSARSNAGNATGEFLRRLVIEIEEERETLERLMTQLGLKPSRPKVVAAWVAEKVGRLKLNGQVRGYSPLSRVLELESLAVGIAGK